MVDLIEQESTDSWERDLLIGHPESVWWAVYDAGRRPVGLAVVTVDSEVALIWSLACRAPSGRWLLHTELVAEMAERGVECLLVATKMAPALQPGLQHFQRLLGYQVAHLKLQ